MDLATSQKPDYHSGISRIITFLLKLIPIIPALWLIAHTYVAGISEARTFQTKNFYAANGALISDWKYYRNMFFYAYAVITFVIGVITMLIKHGKQSPIGILVTQMLPNIIMGMILVTFSYAIAGMLLSVTYTIYPMMGK